MLLNHLKYQFAQRFNRAYPIEPLIVFRILFGALMAVGALRFMYQGWIEQLYLEPTFFFKFHGFHWVEVLSPFGMYALYSLIALSAVFVAVGLFYRISIVVFFLAFSYTELIDATNYLNHYYLVCLLAFLLLFLPAHRAFSFDVWRKPQLRVSHIPAICIYILMLQLGCVYFFAGLAKLNSDWLFHAMPLAIWLPSKTDIPILSLLFQQAWIPFAFSWFGAFYDLTISFFLLSPKTRVLAYLAVLLFHLLTKLLFNIGLFPMIMIFSTLIFFSPTFHQKLLRPFGYRPMNKTKNYVFPKVSLRVLRPILAIYLTIQLLFPLRHLLYSGNVLWTEEAYRFSWRVMLVEKVGQATFYVQDRASKRASEIQNQHYLTEFQEKQMTVQPDFILQFAQHIAKEYTKIYGFQDPIVTVDIYVALNGRTSQRLIDPTINLAIQNDGWQAKKWILKKKEQ